jgi:thioesterase domain-containing protein
VSTRASFFELGGHSLMAVRLVRDINAACGSKLGVGALFKHPSVAELARHVTSEGGQLSSAVVPLQTGSREPPLYFVCGIQLYQELARNLGDQASFGLFVRDEEQFLESAGSAAGSSIPALARAYVDAIRAHRPHGPYAVAGISFGGLLAFEVARQLKAGGDEVSLLVLLDAVLPASLRRNSLRRVTHAFDKLKRMGVRGTLEQARAALNRWLGRKPRATADLRAELLWRAFSGQAARAYFASQPEYSGPTLIVRARDRSGLVGYDVPPHLGWHPYLTGCLHISEAPGDHLGVLRSAETALTLERELALWGHTEA